MGFTVLLGIAYIFLAAGTVTAFARKNKVVGIILLSVIASSVLVLGYLWLTSPM